MPSVSLQIFVYVIIGFILLFVMRGISYRHTVPGSFALAVSLPVVMGWFTLLGSRIHVTERAAIMSTLIVLSVAISTILSQRPDIAIKHLITYSAAVFLGMAFSCFDIWPIILAVAVIHSVFVITPLAKSNAGIMGNSNFAGAFLAPCAFIALHSGQYLVAAFILLALVKTRCRGGILGAIIGMAFVNPWFALVASLCSYRLFFGRGCASSLKIRLKTWLLSMNDLSLKQFFFGAGGDVGALYFMKNKLAKTRLRRIHSDIFQGIWDCGAIYVALYLFIGIEAICNAPPWISGGIIALMVAGLFVDTQLLPTTGLLFWLMVGQVNTCEAGYLIDGWWPMSILMAVLVAQTWGRAFIADVLYGIAYRHKRPMLMAIAHRVNPKDQIVLAGLVSSLIAIGEHEGAFHKAMELTAGYDGDIKPETVALLLATAAFNVGTYGMAKVNAERVLSYGENRGARQLLLLIKNKTV